ncbi:MAG: hypothetical protein KF887_05720 [Paracoccaceae bacterium]|nr:MAG: hypothetical protein KF887_05720 [Paracoccaceae bacterium]
MRALTLALSLALATPAAADLSLSREIGSNGLARTEARLAALADPTADDLFALAGVRFLRGVEGALQLRWQTGVRADWSELPIMRLPIPENPAARAFRPDDLTDLLTGVQTNMDAARDALARLDGREVAVEIALSDLWFDINGNGSRDAGEEVSRVAGLTMAGAARGFMEPPPDPVIRFDTADAAWLGAYTHFLSAFATLALAFDPAPAVERVLASSAAMKELWGDTPPPNALDAIFGRQVDRAAIILIALSTPPDATLTKAAHGHLTAMIAENRRFWALVEAESDNDREWVPNDRQESALGIRMPEGTGKRWQAVLADAEGLLEGRLLMPHWRMGAEAGLNLRKMFENPPAVDLVTWVQGEGLLPYAEKGERVSPANWQDFESLVRGDAVMFAVLLN